MDPRLSLFGMALALIGGIYALSGAKFEMPAFVGTMSSGSAPEGDPKDPNSYLRSESDGWIARGPIAATQLGGPVFIDAVLDGHRATTRNHVPGEVATLTAMDGCAFTPPGADMRIGHVTVGRSGMPTGVATYGDPELAAAVERFARIYRQSGLRSFDNVGDGAYEAFDVAVTETARPVYLVLEASGAPRIWNIHLAPGARVAHVALVGGLQAGVANLDPAVPVEVLPQAALQACGIDPAYPLNPDALFYQSLANGAISPEEGAETIGRIEQAVAAYDAWFRGQFGVGAGEGRAGYDEVAVAVVGPIPGKGEALPAWQSLDGAAVRMTRDTYYEIKGQMAEGEDFRARVERIATEFAWGDLENLRKPATEARN